MSPREFNPAKCLRQRDPDKLPKLRVALGNASVHELRELNISNFSQLFGDSDAALARSWAINLEFTRRGIGPRWRGIGPFNPSAVPKAGPWLGLPSSLPALHSLPMQQKLFLRWVDLHWLRCELGPSHFPNNLSYRYLFSGTLSEDEREGLFTNLAESDDKPHRIIFGLAVIEPLTLSLKGFAEAKAGDRYKTVRKRLKSAIQPHLEAMGDRPRYPLGVDAIAKRLVYAEAIELARGKPTDTARFVRWISGETVTPQAALKMRKKMAVELRLIGRAWTQRRSS